MQIQCFHPGHLLLGEGPIWAAREHALYCVDILGRQLHRWHLPTHTHQRWDMPEPLCAISFAQQGGLIAALATRIVSIELPSMNMATLKQLFREDDEVMLNDGKRDSQGRFWVGSKDKEGKRPLGKLFRFNADGQSYKIMEDQLTIANGLDWSPDQRTFYLTDLPNIYAYDYESVSGEISNRRVFATIDPSIGVPDGLVVDEQGYVWSAIWNGWRLHRYRPDGQLDKVIDMPIQRPTNLCFGGDNLQQLFVTSACCDLSELSLLQQPRAGSVFQIKF